MTMTMTLPMASFREHSHTGRTFASRLADFINKLGARRRTVAERGRIPPEHGGARNCVRQIDVRERGERTLVKGRNQGQHQWVTDDKQAPTREAKERAEVAAHIRDQIADVLAIARARGSWRLVLLLELARAEADDQSRDLGACD